MYVSVKSGLLFKISINTQKLNECF